MPANTRKRVSLTSIHGGSTPESFLRHNMARNVFVALVAYFALAVGFSGLLIWTLSAQPLFPFQPDNAAWSSAWLFTTVGDYYVSTFCLCGVILWTAGSREGTAWTLACCLLGSPFACAWVILRLWNYHSLACAQAGQEQVSYKRAVFAPLDVMPTSSVAFIAFYATLAVSFAALLARTLSAQPLFPFQPDDAAWCSAWLFTTVGDYYVSTFCLCGVILWTDGAVYGTAWTLACCLLGSPSACAWVILRLCKHRTLALSS